MRVVLQSRWTSLVSINFIPIKVIFFHRRSESLSILENFLRLRQACCDLGLLLDAVKVKSEKLISRSEEDDDDNPQEKSDAQYVIFKDVKQLCQAAEQEPALPAKVIVLINLLGRIYSHHSNVKILIFTE